MVDLPEHERICERRISNMKIAIGCDPNAQKEKEEVIAFIEKKGYGTVEDFGSEDSILSLIHI